MFRYALLRILGAIPTLFLVVAIAFLMLHAAPGGPFDAERAPNSWTVGPGDSFWKIAEEELGDAWGRDDLTDAEVATYWRTLIAQNMDRLVEPGNPDLLFPGQELMLPIVPPAPR